MVDCCLMTNGDVDAVAAAAVGLDASVDVALFDS